MEEDDEDEDDFIDDDDRPDLPQIAGHMTESGFEPDDSWLCGADWRLQHEAMRQWFLTRFEDPAQNTPYNGAEGGYLYIHGGPCTAEDELYKRFASVVKEPDEYIRRVIDDVESEGLTEWAPIRHEREDEYDDRFALSIHVGSEPLRRLRERLQQAKQVLTLTGDANAMTLAQNLVFASAISTVEAFLYEVAYFWIDTDEKALRSVVTQLSEFRDEKIKLGDMFDRLKGLKAHVKGRLQAIVWHRWDQVAQIYRAALDVRLPSVAALDKALLKRHDIVHRSGHDKEGRPVTITREDIDELCTAIEEFAAELDGRIDARGFDLGDPDGPAPPD